MAKETDKEKKPSRRYLIFFGFILGIIFSFLAARYLYWDKNQVPKTGAQQEIKNLTVANFASPNVSQWTNDAGYLTQVNYGIIKNGNGIYMDYRPNNVSCLNNQILKYDATNARWVCAVDDSSGSGTSVWGSITGNITDQTDLKFALDTKLSTSTVLNGDVTGSLSSTVVQNDSHNHTGATISDLTVGDFVSANVSQWTNDAGYITGVNYGQITNGSGVYFNYKPNDVACAQNQVLKYDTNNSRWVCADDAGGGTVTWGNIGGNITDQADLGALLNGKLGITAGFGGDVSGTYNAIVISDDSHNHTGATISGLGVGDFTSQNVSQWTNDAGYITGVNASQVANGTGVYFNYKPNNTACTQDQVLKYDANNNRWICGTDSTGVSSISWGAINGNINDQADLVAMFAGKVGVTAAFGGDVTGTYNNISVSDDSHNHTGATISNLSVADFTSPNVSQWTNDAGYLTSVNAGQIANGAGIYLNYRPNNIACGQDQVLKYDATNSRWICGDDTSGTTLTEGQVETYITNGALNFASGSTVGGALIADRTWVAAQGYMTSYTETDPTLASWAGSANLTTVGTITSGTWHGTPITTAYIQDSTILFADLAQNGCTDGQVIKWNSGASAWQCGNDNASTGGTGSSLSPIVSVTTVQTRTQGTYTALTTGDGTPITPLDIVMTPKKAGNKVILEWVVSSESVNDIVYTVYRNGVLLPNVTNATNNRWAGTATVPYDPDMDSSPSISTIRIIDENSLNVASTYQLAVRASGGTQYNFYLNRTINSTGKDAYEAGLSTGTATEIDPNGGSSLGATAVNMVQSYGTSDVSTSTVSWVDMPDMTANITTTGGPIEINFSAGVGNSTANGIGRFQLLLDGAAVGTPTKVRVPTNTVGSTANLIWTTTPSSGAHTIKVQWYAEVGTVYNRAAAGNEHRTLIVKEYLGTVVGGGGSTTVGSMTGSSLFADATADDDWLGLGSSAGRMEFDDQTIDEINFLNANVGINTQTPTHTLDVNGNIGLATSSYINFGATDGSGGYGFRDNGGVIEYKDQGGTWKALNTLSGGSAGGVVASVTTVQTRTPTYFPMPALTDVAITPLDITLTPKKAGNKVILEWVVNYETSYNVVFLVKRNGVMLPNSTDGSNNVYAGIATAGYDQDVASTPNNTTIKIVDENSLAVATTYTLYVRASNTTDVTTFYLNRTVASAGANSYETGHSVGTATEIDPSATGGGSGTITVGSMSGSSVFADATADGDWLGLGSNAGRILFADQATDSVLIMDANVGIGTLTPFHKLDVNGNIGLASSSYINFGTTDGLNGYGLRDNGGEIEAKNSSGLWSSLLPEYILIRDEEVTHGGPITGGSWFTRQLNTEVTDEGNNATLAGNVITLQPGTYRCYITVPAALVNAHQGRLYDQTNNATLLVGTSELSDSYVMTRSVISGVFTLNAATNVVVQQYAANTNNNSWASGHMSPSGEKSIYVNAEFWKIR